MASTMVIKVKYEDTLRRFNARVDDNDQLDLDMSGLRSKIFSLFNLPSDADISMAYFDEDGDTVTLVDDDDLREAMRQKLKFLRIDVHVGSDKSGKSNAQSSGTSTPLRSPQGPSPIPNFNSGAVEVLNSLPEPLRELATKAGSSRPVFAEIVDILLKMGLSHLIPESQVQAGGDFGTQSGSSNHPVAPVAGSSSNDVKDDGKPEKSLAPNAVNVNKDEDMSVSPRHATVDLNSLPNELHGISPIPPRGSHVHTSGGDGRKEAFHSSRTEKKLKYLKPPGCGASTSSVVSPRQLHHDMAINRLNECPFLGTAIANDSAAAGSCLPIPFKRNHAEAMGGTFHAGVGCDGCGRLPIIGPRFKSIVKENYDLCHICYSSMDNAADYIRFDHPMTYRHTRPPFKGLIYEQPPWPPAFPKITRGFNMKPECPKLDSRFVLDVNLMDNTLIAPSTQFTKIWRMRNNGGLVWPQGTQLMWIGGDKFSKSDSVEIEIPSYGVAAENELDIAVDFIAPESPGRYISHWRMASLSGQKFGQRVWVLIQVDASSKDSFVESFQGLNLNLPPDVSFPENIDVNQPPRGSDDLHPRGSSSVKEPVNLVPNEQPENDQELHFPINDSLLVGHSASSPTEPLDSPTVSYPTVEVFKSPPTSPKSAPAPNAPASSEDTSSNNPVEFILLKELEEMGFKQVNLNKKILRNNDYDLEQSVDDLCDVGDWYPILEELQAMGFCDTQMNKKLLVKNNGSIKHVVMDLISEEKLSLEDN